MVLLKISLAMKSWHMVKEAFNMTLSICPYPTGTLVFRVLRYSELILMSPSNRKYRASLLMA